MSLQSAVQSDDRQLVGDLHSLPKPERRLCNQDVYALEWAIPHSGGERHTLEGLIREAQSIIRAELLQSDPFLDGLLAAGLGSQFRSRPDFARGKLAIEQWIPSMDCWMVNGYFDFRTPYRTIVSVLEAGDPRKQTPSEHLEEVRAAAAAKRESNERKSTDKVLGVIDSLTSRQVENFVAVEQALHTGENITLRGDDRRRIESLVEQTKEAAHKGDREAQKVVTMGQQDTPLCITPNSNPLRRRNRKARTQP